MKDRLNDMLDQADELAEASNILQRMYDLMQQLADANHRVTRQRVTLAVDHGGVEGSHCGFRRFLAADPELLLLGAALLLYSALLVAAILI